MNAKQHFADHFNRENATTRRVIHAIPHEKSEFRPSPNVSSYRDVAHIFTISQGGIAAALTGRWQWPPVFPPAPASYADVLAGFDTTTAMVKDALAGTPDSRFADKVTFFTGPRQAGDIPVNDLVWFMLHDAIHHRGQLSIYLRVAGEKVPSIYGPTADEKW